MATLYYYQAFKSSGNDIAPNMHYIITPSTEVNDIIYLGNSRIFVHVDPLIVDSIAGTRGYNLALDGSMIVYFHMALAKYLQVHPTPRYAVISTDFTSLNTDLLVYNYPDYQQYLGDSLVYADLAGYREEFRSGLFMKYSIFRKINSKPDSEKVGNLLYLIKSLFSLGRITFASDPHRGYEYSVRTWQTEPHTVKSFTPHPTALGYELLRRMIAECQQKGVKVILLFTPLYKDYHHIVVNGTQLQDSIKHIADTFRVPYWNYADTYISDTTANFSNVEHLNGPGSRIFSCILGEDIKRYIADSTYSPPPRLHKP
jgi:hypothetical protein